MNSGFGKQWGVSAYLTIMSVLEGNEGTRRMKEEGELDLMDVKCRYGGTKEMLTKSSAHTGGNVFRSGENSRNAPQDHTI